MSAVLKVCLKIGDGQVWRFRKQLVTNSDGALVAGLEKESTCVEREEV